MKSEQIQKRIAYSYETILTAKVRNFYKRSLLKYSFSALIYSIGLSYLRGINPLSTTGALVFVNFFLIVIALSFILIFVSSFLMARKYADQSMIYTFSAEGIHIYNEINEQEEEHGWDWIRSHELGKKALYLLINSRKPFEIILSRDRMSDQEIEPILSWLA